MSARLLKGGTPSGIACALFAIPARSARQAASASETPPPTASAAAAEPRPDPQEQARALMEAARDEAARCVAEAQAQVAAIEQEAYEKGLTAARVQGSEEIKAAVADLRTRLTTTLAELEPLYTVITARAEHDLVKLSLEIARKIIHREVTTGADIVLPLVRLALERLHPRALATVRLHPEDFEYVKAQRQVLSSNSAIEIVADQSVGRGGCIVQSEHGDIDARLEQQLALLERSFFE